LITPEQDGGQWMLQLIKPIGNITLVLMPCGWVKHSFLVLRYLLGDFCFISLKKAKGLMVVPEQPT
jgi:hypothetical protein